MNYKSTTEEKFLAAVQVVQDLPKEGPFQPSRELKLKLYSCYKQATVGPCNVSRPSFWDVVNRAKWDSWYQLGVMDKEEAMTLYVSEIAKVIEMMPQTAEVRELTKKLGNVYEWVEPEGETSPVDDPQRRESRRNEVVEKTNDNAIEVVAKSKPHLVGNGIHLPHRPNTIRPADYGTNSTPLGNLVSSSPFLQMNQHQSPFNASLFATRMVTGQTMLNGDAKDGDASLDGVEDDSDEDDDESKAAMTKDSATALATEAAEVEESEGDEEFCESVNAMAQLGPSGLERQASTERRNSETTAKTTSATSICSTDSEAFFTPALISPREENLPTTSLVPLPVEAIFVASNDKPVHDSIGEKLSRVVSDSAGARPKISQRDRVVAPSPPEASDELRVLTDVADVSLGRARETNDRGRLTSTCRRDDEADSSSDSSEHSRWSGGGRRRNFDDWPIRSGDDSFKAVKSRRHRGGSDTSATGGRTSLTGPHGPAGSSSRVRGLAVSARGRSSGNPATNSGADGGERPPHRSASVAVNEQIAVALLRIQQDVSSLSSRMNTLETLFWTSRNGARPESAPIQSNTNAESGLAPIDTPPINHLFSTACSWLFPGFTTRSVVFLLLWPVLFRAAWAIVKALLWLALSKRRRFSAFDDHPPL